MKTAFAGIILAVLMASEGPRVARRAVVNRELVGCLQSTQCRNVPCAMSLREDYARAKYHLGIEALRSGRPLEAIRLLRTDSDDGTQDLVGYYLGLAYRQAGNETAALAVWRASGAARAFAAIGRRDGSVDALRTAIAAGNSDPVVFYKLGDLLWESGRVDQACASYREGIAADRNNQPDRLLATARIAEGEGDWLKAVAINQAAIDQKPDDDQGYLQAAGILRRKNLSARAIDVYAKCAARTNSMSCYLGAGETCLATGDIASALRWCNGARRSFPRKSEPLTLLGNISLAAGRPEDASRAFAEAASIDPLNFWIPVYQGDLEASRGHLDAALQYYGRAARLNPNSPAVYYSFGQAYQRRGQLDAAAASYRKALALMPGLAAASNALEIMEAGRHRDELTQPRGTTHVQ